jgi:tRNA (Thr-GGU) A37 N-methylase
MDERTPDHKETYHVHPIGYVRRTENGIHLEILEPFRPGLRQLDHFSHVIAFWWADRHDNAESRSIMQTRPPYAHDKLTGVFATRAEYRPNPIAMTT